MNPLYIASGVTALWVVMWIIFTFARVDDLFAMKLSEIGDYLAGSFAPIAFGWLVLGYFQQGKELRQNTEALRQQGDSLDLQVKELQNSVEQQAALAETANAEFELIRGRNEAEVKRQKSRAQPYFLFMRTSMSDEVEGIKFSMMLKNLGHEVRAVRVSLWEESCEMPGVSVEEELYSVWQNEAEHPVIFTRSDNRRMDQGEWFPIELTYRDGLGEEETIRMLVAGTESGNPKAVPVELLKESGLVND